MRRTRMLTAHLAQGAPDVSSAGTAASEQVDMLRTGAPTATRAPKLLNDHSVRQFITEGFLILSLNEDLSPEFHATVHKQVENLPGQAAIGNNIFPAIPALGDMLASPTVNGALCSVLGHDYALHAHRALHRADRPDEQGFHKDGQEGHGPHRHHRPRWAMVMYYPAGCTLEMAVSRPYHRDAWHREANMACVPLRDSQQQSCLVVSTLLSTMERWGASQRPTESPSVFPSSSSLRHYVKAPRCCCISTCALACVYL